MDWIRSDLLSVGRKTVAALASKTVAGSDLKGSSSQELHIPLPLTY